jgi:hypothetical protein
MSGRAQNRKGHLARARGPSATRRGQLIAAVLSLAGHLAAILALVSALMPPPRAAEPIPMKVTLVDWPPPAPKATPLVAAAPSAVEPPAQIDHTPAVAPRAAIAVRVTTQAPAAVAASPGDAGAGLSDAQIAGAATAGSGPAGRPCDMLRRLESALRKDPLVQAAVAGSNARAMLVWNGDWVRSNREDGKGLAAVREAIMWEVAFAPPACRAEPVRGLVLLSVSAAPGSVRLAIGSAEWRWSDLLTPSHVLSGVAGVAAAG